MSNSANPWTVACQAPLSSSVPWILLKFISIESVTLTISSSAASFSCPQSVPASGSSLHIRWPNYRSFNFSISPSNEYSGLISFRIDWFELLSVWGTLKSLLWHHRSKASILWLSAFFMVQFPHIYINTGKTITLTIRTFVNKMISLLFNMLSGLS